MNNINFNYSYSNNTILQNISRSECLYNFSYTSQLNCTQLILYMNNYSSKCNNKLMKNITNCIKEEEDDFSLIPYLILLPCILVCTYYIFICLFAILKALCECFYNTMNEFCECFYNTMNELCNCLQYSSCCLIKYIKKCIILFVGNSGVNNINIEQGVNNINIEQGVNNFNSEQGVNNFNIKSSIILLQDNNSNKELTCVICIDQLFNDNIKILNLECNHKFHMDCLFQWIHQSMNTHNAINCPICRHKMNISF